MVDSFKNDESLSWRFLDLSLVIFEAAQIQSILAWGDKIIAFFCATRILRKPFSNPVFNLKCQVGKIKTKPIKIWFLSPLRRTNSNFEGLQTAGFELNADWWLHKDIKMSVWSWELIRRKWDLVRQSKIGVTRNSRPRGVQNSPKQTKYKFEVRQHDVPEEARSPRCAARWALESRDYKNTWQPNCHVVSMKHDAEAFLRRKNETNDHSVSFKT